MKSSVILAASSAALGLAGVVAPRDAYTEVKVVYEYVTVTQGGPYAVAAPTTTVQEKQPEASPQYEVYYYTVTEGDKPKETPKAKTSSPVYEQAAPPASSSKAASPTKGTNYATPSDLASAAVIHHNYHRANHSSPDIKWADDLAASAAECAKACDMNHNLAPGGGGYGQNLASWGTSESLDSLTDASAVGSAISDMWYDGEWSGYASYFGQEPGGSFESWGHLTQVVWAGSTEVGCAVARCPMGTMYQGFNAVEIVCNYRPAGNVGGGYASNVGKSINNPTVHS